jgi:hypothetical protein
MRRLAFRNSSAKLIDGSAVDADIGWAAPKTSTLNGEPYDNLEEASAFESSARRAADPLAAYHNPFASIDTAKL